MHYYSIYYNIVHISKRNAAPRPIIRLTSGRRYKMSLKIERAFTKAGIPEMPMVRRHILANLRKVEADLDCLTSTEIAYIIKGLNIGYHDAKGNQKADYMADMDCVWIGGEVEKLLPIEVLKAITITETKTPVKRTGQRVGHSPNCWMPENDYEYKNEIHYKLEYTETV